jgi:hypothetical protein
MFLVCSSHQILEWNKHRMWDICGRKEMHTGFWWGKPEGKRPLCRPTCMSGYNTKRYPKEIEWVGEAYVFD